MNMGAFPSGQWGQTVNLLLNASVVRIHQLPPKACDKKDVAGFFLCCIDENRRFRQPIFELRFIKMSSGFQNVFNFPAANFLLAAGIFCFFGSFQFVFKFSILYLWLTHP